jgi:hypothetical protein
MTTSEPNGPLALVITGFLQDFGLSEFHLTTSPNQQYSDLVLSRYEGRFAIVTNAGWDAVDVEAPLTNGADAYGKVAWS